jgi:type II secretory pathway pseudopilin PulG
LTLVELVFVVAILAILAAFLAPRFGFIRGMAASAGGADQANEVIKLAMLQNGLGLGHPKGVDSLLEAPGGSNFYSRLPARLKRTLRVASSGDPDWDAQAWTSFLSSAGGVLQNGTWVSSSTTLTWYHHDNSVADANFSATSEQVTTSQPSIAVVNAGTPEGKQVYVEFYGQNRLGADGKPLDGTRLVAYGVGPNITLQGKTAQNIPSVYSENGEYGRIILLVKVYPASTNIPNVSPGAGGALMGALTPDGRTVSANLSNYKASAAK